MKASLLKRIPICVSLAVFLLSAERLGAQSRVVIEAADLAECTALEEDAERLACFDALTAEMSLANEGEGGADTLYTFSGKGDGDSDPISVEQSWALQWDFDGSIMTVELRTDQNQLVKPIAQQIGKGAGRSDPQDRGEYILSVRGIGNWTLKILPVE